VIVTLTAEAEADLENIGDYIALDNPQRAMSFVRELRARCERLAETPEAFPLVPRYEATGVRRRVHGNFLIFYRVEANAITVVHVLHGAMNYEPLLFPQG
jgi:plasmid stabilization system protein ParE